MGARTGNPTWVDSATVQEAEANPSRKITAAKLNAIEGAIDNSAEAVHDHDATDISDSTATGRAVLTAADAATARTAIGAAPATQTINAKTGAYTLVASDAGKLITMTLATPADLTVPANVFTAGQRVDIADRGTARVTVVAGSGMTVNPPAGGSLVMEGRYAYASLVFVSATEADLVGLVAAS